MLSKRDRRTLSRLIEADGASFKELVTLARLDPARAFRGADLRGIDFGSIDLAGYDFSDADLTGASLAQASTAGATFASAIVEDVRWPTHPPRKSDQAGYLSALQEEALKNMIQDLDARSRALALMPTGTGRSGVLETIIAYTLDRGMRGVLLVNTAAERDQFIQRLRTRLGAGVVAAARDADRHQDVRLIVQNTTFRDFRMGAFPGPLGREYPPHLDLLRGGCLFTTSIEKVEQFMQSGLDEYEPKLVATVDNLPVGADRPERHRLLSRARRYFKRPSFMVEAEQAVELGLLAPVRIVAPPTLIYKYGDAMRSVRRGSDDIYRALGSLAKDLGMLFDRLKEQNLFVLCRDSAHADLLAHRLIEGSALAEPVRITRLGARWDVHGDAPKSAGIVIAPASNQAMIAAREHPRVAVLAPLNPSRAQDLAYRPARLADEDAVIFDLVDAFSGFPGRDLHHPVFN